MTNRVLLVSGVIVKTCGHAACIVVLVTASFITGVISSTARSMVSLIACISGATIETDRLEPHRERYLTFQRSVSDSQGDSDLRIPHPLLAYCPGTGANGEPQSEPFQILDEEGTLQKVRKDLLENGHTVEIIGNEEALIKLTHRFISYEFGCLDQSLLAEDFQFVFPVVGPLTKAEFVEAFSSFKVRDAFPNARSNFYNFKIDPLEPNRIWAISRGSFMQEGTLSFGPGNNFPPPPKHNRCKIHLPPQCFSFSFNEAGKCYKMTGGYCIDRSVGDTDGLGGLFGVLHAMGGRASRLLPFPEGHPWNRNTRSLNWEAFSLRIPQIVKDWRGALK